MLLKLLLDLSGDFFLLLGEVNRVSDLFTVAASLNYPIKCWAFSCLSMRVVAANCIDLDVKAIGWQEFFVDVRAFGPDGRLTKIMRDELARVVIGFPEQDIVSWPAWVQVAIIYLDLMIFGVHRFLNKRLLKLFTIDHDKVFVLFEIKVWVLV